MEILKSNTTELHREKLSNLTTSFPKQKDWEGAANGIFLLQEHYNLEIGALAEGGITLEEGGRLQGEHMLEAEDLFQIG